MLLADQRKIKFEKRYQKVLHAFPTINNSICFLGILGPRQDCLTHMGADGKVIKQLVFSENIDSFAVLSQREVMILETRKNNILVWNLQTNQKTIIPFHFKTVETDQSQIFVFPDTQLICVQENGRYNNNTFRLSYFQYPLNQKSQPVYQFDDDQVWTYEYMIRKGNNNSMICWFKGRHDDGFQFRTFDLRDINLNNKELQGKKISHKTYNFPNQISKMYNINQKAEVALTTMWQMTPQKFMLVCITSLSNTNDKINSNFVYTAGDNMMRPAKFQFGIYNDLIIDQYNFGTTCMFRTFDFENGQPKQTPVYYINNETQQIIAQQTWKCSYLYKYDFPGYDGNLILELQYENGNVEEIKVNAKKIMQPKEITIHFLLELYEGWDQDALRQAVQVIGEVNQS